MSESEIAAVAAEVEREVRLSKVGETVVLANGEEWQFGGYYWHLVGSVNYSPVQDRHFAGYATTIAAGSPR